MLLRHPPFQALLPFGDTRFVPALDQSVPLQGDSITTTDAYSAMKATGFRISKEFIESQMAAIHFLNLGAAMEMANLPGTASEHRTTICSITMRNGFAVVGKSTPLDPVNFDVEKGKRFAYEDAFRQLWPLLAFAWLAATEADRDADGFAPDPDADPDPYRGADASNEVCDVGEPEGGD